MTDILSHYAETGAIYAGLFPQRRGGGLAPWQVHKTTTHIAEQIDRGVSVATLAGRVRLSSSHFCRAFKASVGLPPHAYLIRLRIERAKAMMLETTDSLSQISIACGFSDQAHLSRVFLKIAGSTPNAWRRAQQRAANS